MGDNGGLGYPPHSYMIAGLRRDLELISKLLTGHGNEDSERAPHFSNLVSASMSDNSEDLKQLSHQQLINHFKTVMNQMKRDHDFTIQQITEDYFSIKRRCFKLDLQQHPSASFSSFNKNNEFDALPNNIPHIISKLDNILLEYENLAFQGKRHADHNISQQKLIHKLQTDVQDSLFDASSICKDVYGFFVNQIQETDLKHHTMTEASELVARDLVASNSKIDFQDSWVESFMTKEYCTVIYKGALKEAGKKLEELNVNVSEKEVALRSELVKNERLKDEIHELECLLVKEKENDLAREREKLEQINNLQTQIGQQAAVIQDKNTQLKGYEMEISSLGQELELCRKNMKITENEKVNHEIKLSSMVLSLGEWSKTFDNLEGRVAQRTKKTNSRLRSMQRLLSEVSNEVDELKARELMYKKQMEKKTCDLQKAETEVDLLGNEVESLLDLLKKIYIALDHYSPILKHYPGIIEILKLVRRELRGESKRYSVF